jgi:hypothetical protein
MRTNGPSRNAAKSSWQMILGLAVVLMAAAIANTPVQAKSTTWLHNGSTLELWPTLAAAYRPGLSTTQVPPTMHAQDSALNLSM